MSVTWILPKNFNIILYKFFYAFINLSFFFLMHFKFPCQYQFSSKYFISLCVIKYIWVFVFVCTFVDKIILEHKYVFCLRRADEGLPWQSSG